MHHLVLQSPVLNGLFIIWSCDKSVLLWPSYFNSHEKSLQDKDILGKMLNRYVD